MTVAAKGLEGIVAASTRLSDVQGDKGVLIYAGYNIDDLAGKVSYEEVVYLLYHGHLPNRTQLEELKQRLIKQRELPQGVIDFIQHAPKDAGPMDVIRTGVSMLGLYDTGQNDTDNLDINRLRAKSIVAKIPIIT